MNKMANQGEKQYKDDFTEALDGLSNADLYTLVENFLHNCKLKDFVELKTLKRGALLAQNKKYLRDPPAQGQNHVSDSSDPHPSSGPINNEPTLNKPSLNEPNLNDEIPNDGILNDQILNDPNHKNPFQDALTPHINSTRTSISLPKNGIFFNDTNPTTYAKQASQPFHLSHDERYLTSYENQALLREERGEMKSLTKALRVILATCAVAAVVQGWSQQNIVGANLNWPVDLKIATQSDDGSFQWIHHRNLRYFALVNAMPYFSASILGSWVSDPITERLGRRGALFFAGACSLAGPIGGGYCPTWQWLLFCRLIQGLGIGAKSSVVPVIESEVSPHLMRGKLLVSWQTFVAIGIFLGAAANLVFKGDWRLQFGIAFVPAVTLLCLCFIIGETPHWLIKKNQYGKAYLALKDLRETPLQAARDLFLIHTRLKAEEILFSKSYPTEQDYLRLFVEGKELSTPYHTKKGFFGKLNNLKFTSRNRNAVLGSCIAMAAQQCSGINIFVFLATTIFGNSGIKSTKALWFTFGFTATNAIFSAAAFFIIHLLKERIAGRRSLLLWSLIIMFPLLLLTGYFLDHQKNDSNSVIALVIVYTAVYSPGAGVIPFMYSSEVFPLINREVGMSLAVSVNFVLAGVVAILVPLFSKHLKFLELLGTFAGLDIFAAFMVWLFMRSPDEAVSLEEMNNLFIPSVASYVTYQLQHVLPESLKYVTSYAQYQLRHVISGILGQRQVPNEPFVEWYDDKKKSFVEWHDDRKKEMQRHRGTEMGVVRS